MSSNVTKFRDSVGKFRHPRRRAAFTIVSANYIGFAATLMQSVAKHMTEADRYIVLADTYQEFPGVDLSACVLECDKLGIRLIQNMKTWYSVMEFNTAIKPSVFLYLFEQLGYDEAYYLDPDVLVLSDMTEAFFALQRHSCVLTPHVLHPLQDGREPSDLTIMKSGVYNLGFLGLRNDVEGCRLAKWWADRCYLNCRVDIAGNMFTDQRWMDLAPVLVSRPFILRHPGYNVAYWNLLHRAVTLSEAGEWGVNGERLVFFHFSGIAPDRPEQFSKHQNRYSPATLGEVNILCDRYRRAVLDNHWADYSKVPYGFNNYGADRCHDEVTRRWIVRSVDDGKFDSTSELVFTSDYFDQPDEEACDRGVFLTRYMYQLWLLRKDLRDAFDVFTLNGLEGYSEWFLGGDAAAQGIDPRSISAARLLRQREPGVRSNNAVLKSPPWPPRSSGTWANSSGEVAAGLSQEVTIHVAGHDICLPLQAALAWEQRPDLQEAFDLISLESCQSYLCWVVTSGLSSGSIDASYLSATFISSFKQLSSITTYYGDVPITEGMILLRNVSVSREGVAGWERFPVEKTGRLAHGLWFAFVAPTLFAWPVDLASAVRTYFLQPTTVVVDKFALNRSSVALWEIRADLQRAFPLTSNLSVWKYLRWLVSEGVRGLNIAVGLLDPRLPSFLLSDSPRFDEISQLLEMVYDERRDLQDNFDIQTKAGRQALIAWSTDHLASELSGLPLGQLLVSSSPEGETIELRVYRASIALTGYWSAPTGRGEDVRTASHALNTVGYLDYVVVDLGSGRVLFPDGQELHESVRLETDFNIVYTNPDTAAYDAQRLRELRVLAKRVIGFWAWELEWLPDYWRASYSYYDEIWASTSFAQSAFLREKLRPVKLVPMSVVLPPSKPELSRLDFGLPEGRTVFLFVFDYRSYSARKNPEAIIKAFDFAFPTGQEPVYLLIKTNGAAERPREAAALRALAIDPRIELRDVELSRSQVVSLIALADAFVSLHRSEGFGRGPAEAMLLDVPVILTNYSGSTDYATKDCALLVDYSLVPVNLGEYPGVTGQRWADADPLSAARHMRWVHEHPAEARMLGMRGHGKVHNLYNEVSTGLALLHNLGINHSHVPEPHGSTKAVFQVIGER